MFTNNLTRLLGIEFPLILAGMGGVASPKLASSVSNNGCLGVVGLYKHHPEEIPQILKQTALLTNRPFGINLIPEIINDSYLIKQISAILNFAQEKTIPFTFYGLPSLSACQEIINNNHPLIIQIGTLHEAEHAAALGADAIIIQGNEAGGHHLGNQYLKEVFHEIKNRIHHLPLIVAGGISTGQELADYVGLGADGCLCGTLFVASVESDAHEIFKQQVVRSAEHDTTITDLFSIGWPKRPHRVIINDTTTLGKELDAKFIGEASIMNKTYPVPRFSASVPTTHTTGQIGSMAMYCGTSCRYIREIRPVQTILDHFKEEFFTKADRATNLAN
ncbi:NAD(P)H-dependent flavin oxidoreductase [Paenibacillus chitinolyticus]